MTRVKLIQPIGLVVLFSCLWSSPVIFSSVIASYTTGTSVGGFLNGMALAIAASFGWLFALLGAVLLILQKRFGVVFLVIATVAGFAVGGPTLVPFLANILPNGFNSTILINTAYTCISMLIAYARC